MRPLRPRGLPSRFRRATSGLAPAFALAAVAVGTGCGGRASADPPLRAKAVVASAGSTDVLTETATSHATPGFTFASLAAPLGHARKSMSIGALDALGCNKALKRLKVPHVRAPNAARIEQPVIVTGPIEGVHFDTGRTYRARTAASGDAIDCRLAVALVELAKVVKKHGVSTVHVKSFHRPTQPVLDPGAPLRHRIGFAIDIAGFTTRKGKRWEVVKDFHGKIGQSTCGPNAAKPDPETMVARELWAMFCQIGATGAFDSGISPNFNASHFDHMHFDLTTDHPIVFFP